MNPTERYRLKQSIDEELRPYEARAMVWQTPWAELRIVKYDDPWSADRSVVFADLIRDEQDWLARQDKIIQALEALQEEDEE